MDFISIYVIFLLIIKWSRVYFQRKMGHLSVSYDKSLKHILGDPMLTLVQFYSTHYEPRIHTNRASIEQVFFWNQFLTI